MDEQPTQAEESSLESTVKRHRERSGWAHHGGCRALKQITEQANIARA
jgi:hypothetical protein